MSAPVYTADLCDEFDSEIRIADAGFLMFGKRHQFGGPVYCLRVFEDNSLVKEAVNQPGDGRVLVVDGGASLRCALLGGNLAVLAANNGWQGVVINGSIRDTHEINEVELGVLAIATCPRKSTKQGKGEANLTLFFAGVQIAPGDYLYADDDGFVIADRSLRANQ